MNQHKSIGKNSASLKQNNASSHGVGQIFRRGVPGKKWKGRKGGGRKKGGGGGKQLTSVFKHKNKVPPCDLTQCAALISFGKTTRTSVPNSIWHKISWFPDTLSVINNLSKFRVSDNWVIYLCRELTEHVDTLDSPVSSCSEAENRINYKITWKNNA